MSDDVQLPSLGDAFCEGYRQGVEDAEKGAVDSSRALRQSQVEATCREAARIEHFDDQRAVDEAFNPGVGRNDDPPLLDAAVTIAVEDLRPVEVTQSFVQR